MEKCSEAASKLVGESYISQGCNSLRAADKTIRHLIEQRRLPERGWSDIMVERCLKELALMDTNNFNGQFVLNLSLSFCVQLLYITWHLSKEIP